MPDAANRCGRASVNHSLALGGSEVMHEQSKGVVERSKPTGSPLTQRCMQCFGPPRTQMKGTATVQFRPSVSTQHQGQIADGAQRNGWVPKSF